MNNFKSSVPADIQEKLYTLAQAIDLDDVRNRTGEAITESRIDEIEGNYVSGWMPSQDGGFRISQFVRSDIDSSYHFSEKHSEYIQQQEKDCFDMFKHDVLDNDDIDYNDMTEEQKEQYNDYENDWFQDGAVFGVEMFLDGYTDWKAEEKQVTIRTYINYEDAPYFREKYAEDLKVLILEIDEFMSMDIDDIIKQITL